MTTFGFIRHGMTDWNRERRAQGQTDVPLNEEGIRQAKQLAARLAKEDWDYLYSSDLARAKLTAEYIAKARSREVDGYDLRLREKTHGRLDGTTLEDRIKLWGEGWADLDHNEESKESVIARSLDFLQEMSSKHPNKKVLLVSHGAWIARTLEYLLQETELPHLENTSISIMEKGMDYWNCQLIACTKHLDSY
ncbi:MAG: histidine phosphatase family protein [Gorillibacterium sp.]|nr:histidine phosphatase family protein [Gorillibacterium sp.]